MKKIITITILFFSFVSFAQIKVIETVPVEKLGRVNSNFYIQKIGNEYTLFYNTVQTGDEAPSIKKFTFKNLNDDYNGFYTIIANGFAASPLYDIKLELPENYVWLHYIANTDKTLVQFMVSGKDNATGASISEPLSKEQIDKLFQKG
jgi:hypothetical protein